MEPARADELDVRHPQMTQYEVLSVLVSGIGVGLVVRSAQTDARGKRPAARNR